MVCPANKGKSAFGIVWAVRTHYAYFDETERSETEQDPYDQRQGSESEDTGTGGEKGGKADQKKADKIPWSEMAVYALRHRAIGTIGRYTRSDRFRWIKKSH